MSWETVIGLEIHVQLSTESKLFSGGSTGFGAEPNTHVDLIDLGLPGVLPVANREAFYKAIRFGLATNAEINQTSTFDRKNYFYPDLPKGYQITQMALPVVGKGSIKIEVDGEEKIVNITRAHLEEDAGKSIHDLFDGFVCSLEIVDFRFNKNLKEIGAYNLIATNGASEFWIRNSEVFSMNKINFDDHEVDISFNNQIVGEGNVNKVMENPLNSALWLINKISQKGETLLKGQFISTGTCTKAHELIPNTKVSANFGELGKIEFNYN